MKIYNWIDSLFDNKEKRKRWVLWTASLYLIWQLIWLDVFFFNLAKVNSYDSLFTFMGSMSAYSNSVLIRIVFFLISGNHIDFLGLANALFHEVYLFDLFMILICTLAICTRKKGYLMGILGCGYFMFLCAILILGLASRSVSYLIFLLKILSYISLFIFIALTLYILYRIVWSIYRLYDNE